MADRDFRPQTADRRPPKRWHGRCGCGELGDKVGGIVSCEECLARDERGGYGMMRVAGLRQKRGQVGEVAA